MSKLLNEYDVKPIGNYVILKREEMKDVSEGGIFLLNKGKDVSQQCTVLAVGPGLVVSGNTFVATVVKEGDTVLVDRICGVDIEVNGDKLLIARETEIFAVINKK